MQTDPKNCEYCQKPLALRPSEIREGRSTTRYRFCNHQCAAQMKSKRRTLICEVCRKPFQAKADQPARRYCSNDCYFVAHAAEKLSCDRCGKLFVARNYDKDAKYCSQACFHAANKGVPRQPFLRQPRTAETRMKLSLSRMGEGNPNWTGGKTAGQYRFQTALHSWGKATLGTSCTICGTDDANVHHIVPRRWFAHIPMAHFRQNLIVLCKSCHCSTDHKVRVAKRAKKSHCIPFADRLPQAILDQLEQDGSVSRLTPECDFSPLGIVAAQAVLPEWY